MKFSFQSRNWGRVKTQIIDAASGKIISESKWRKNLILDAGLNSFANGNSGFARCFENCLIGSGTTPNSIASGAITFTQAGTTITAGGSFFTSSMVGGIFKFGTGSGGAEFYISAVPDATHATVTTSGSQISPVVGTVWQVQQTALQSLLYQSNNYDVSSGSCGYTITGNTVYLQRTFIFPVQSSPYSVNEIGYSRTGTAINGRFVLSSTDVVPPTAFYRVQIGITFTQTPSAPVSAGNVGTNVNTAGTFSIQNWAFTKVQSNGVSSEYQTALGSSSILDGFCDIWLAFHVGTAPTNNASISTGVLTTQNETYAFDVGHPSNTGQPVGAGVATFNFSFTAAGETMNSIIFGRGVSTGTTPPFAILPNAVLLLTTPVVLPSGPFAGSASVAWQFSRTLTN